MRSFWIAIAFAALLPATLIAMNGAAEIGVGARSKGMGGVGIALPQDSFASAANPAGLVWVGNRVDAGFGATIQGGRNQVYFFATGATNPRQSGKNVASPLWFPEVGVAWRYCCDQSIGLAAFVKGALSTKYNFKLYGNEFDSIPTKFGAYTVNIVPSWSWQIAPRVAVGVAVNGILQFHYNNVNYSGDNASIAPNRPDGQFVGPGTVDLSGGASARVGVLVKAGPGLDVGFTYQLPALMTRLNDYAGQWPAQGYWDWPAELGAGLTFSCHAWCSCWCLSLDWNFFFWSDTKTFGNIFDVSNTAGALSGSNVGPGFGWEDQTVWKAGLAWTPDRCNSLTLRVGYNFGNTPIPREQVFLNQLTLATIQHHVTAGASYRLCRAELSAYYYHGFERMVKGLGPFFFEGFGTANLSNRQNGVGLSLGICW